MDKTVIRSATLDDMPAIWTIFQQVVARGDTFVWTPDIAEASFESLWTGPGQHAYVAELDGEIAGSYMIHPNHDGRGAHVANAAYMVREDCRGRGLARAMCVHSLAEAKRLGYRAMQYNIVVATNVSAIKIWKDCGFSTIGTIPNAFHHAMLGYVDALIMYRTLD